MNHFYANPCQNNDGHIQPSYSGSAPFNTNGNVVFNDPGASTSYSGSAPFNTFNGNVVFNDPGASTSTGVRSNMVLVGPGGDNNITTATAIDECMRYNQMPPCVHLVNDAAHAANPDLNVQNATQQMCPIYMPTAEPIYSCKVFLGGLQHDVHERHIIKKFSQYGIVHVDWPMKNDMKMVYPPKGFAFLIFREERSVQQLIDDCTSMNGMYYTKLSSPYVKNKTVQIRPWRLIDANFILDPNAQFDSRKTIFVGGVPRPLSAQELAMMMERIYGNVCGASITIDEDYMYPRATGRVCFSSHDSYIAAIAARYVQIDFEQKRKSVELKPDVRNDQFCDDCVANNFAPILAPFFCPNITCLKYFCKRCWNIRHAQPDREFHKTLMHGSVECPQPWMDYYN